MDAHALPTSLCLPTFVSKLRRSRSMMLLKKSVGGSCDRDESEGRLIANR